jgi:hypothetical protein
MGAQCKQNERLKNDEAVQILMVGIIITLGTAVSPYNKSIFSLFHQPFVTTYPHKASPQMRNTYTMSQRKKKTPHLVSATKTRVSLDTPTKL